MAEVIPAVIATALIVGSTSVLFGQAPTDSMRLQLGGIYLQSEVSHEFDCIRVAFTEVLRSAGTAGGIVVLSDCAKPDRSPLFVPKLSSVASVLDLLAAAHTQYYWTVQDGVTLFLPKRNRPLVMDVRIPQFEWDTTDSLYSNTQRLFSVPVVRMQLARMSPGLDHGPGLQKPPRIANGVPVLEPPLQGSKHQIENLTLMSACNAVVASYGGGSWWYEEQKCEGKITYSYGSAKAITTRTPPLAYSRRQLRAAPGQHPGR